MKVILLRDVAKLGKKNTVAEVPDGYAQNKLIPSGMAIPANASNLKRLQKVAAATESQQQGEQEAFNQALVTLKDTAVVITTEANAQGGLFQAIKPADVAAAIVQAGVHGVPVDAIQITEPIKSSGEHQVALMFGGQSGTCTVKVEVSS